MSLPQLRSGHVTRAWRVGPAVCVLVDGCRSVQTAEYSHVMFGAVPPDSRVRAGIVAEINPLASFGVSGGSHYLGVFDHRGHRNVGADNAWADAGAFAKRALEVMAESLGIRETAEELEPACLALGLGGGSEPPTLAAGDLKPLGASAPSQASAADAGPPMASLPPQAHGTGRTENPERLFQSVATLLVIDGKFTPAERDHLGVLGRRLGLSPPLADQLTRQVLSGKRSIQFPGATESRWRLFEELVAAAAADGQIHPTELKALGAIAARLGLAPGELQTRLSAALQAAEATVPVDLAYRLHSAGKRSNVLCSGCGRKYALDPSEVPALKKCPGCNRAMGK